MTLRGALAPPSPQCNTPQRFKSLPVNELPPHHGKEASSPRCCPAAGPRAPARAAPSAGAESDPRPRLPLRTAPDTSPPRLRRRGEAGTARLRLRWGELPWAMQPPPPPVERIQSDLGGAARLLPPRCIRALAAGPAAPAHRSPSLSGLRCGSRSG